jgi:hypothetical protein
VYRHLRCYQLLFGQLVLQRWLLQPQDRTTTMHRPRRHMSERPWRRHVLQQRLRDRNLWCARRSLLRNPGGGLHSGWPRVWCRCHWQRLPALRCRGCSLLRDRDKPGKPNLLHYQSCLSADRFWRQRDDARMQGLWRRGGPALLRRWNSHSSHLFRRESGLSNHWWPNRDDIHMPGLRRRHPALLCESDLQRHPQLHRSWRRSDLPVGRPAVAIGKDGEWGVFSCLRCDTIRPIFSSNV